MTQDTRTLADDRFAAAAAKLREIAERSRGDSRARINTGSLETVAELLDEAAAALRTQPEPVAWLHQTMIDGEWRTIKASLAPVATGNLFGFRNVPLFASPPPAHSGERERCLEIFHDLWCLERVAFEQWDREPTVAHKVTLQKAREAVEDAGQKLLMSHPNVASEVPHD